MYHDCTILHVEDSDDDSFLFRRALTKLGFKGTYRRVNTVKEAKAYLSHQAGRADAKEFPQPDLLVTDMTLAVDGNAEELATWVRARPEHKEMPVIVLTGGADLSTQRTVIKAGAVEVLFKGVSFEDLTSNVQRVIERCVTGLG